MLDDTYADESCADEWGAERENRQEQQTSGIHKPLPSQGIDRHTLDVRFCHARIRVADPHVLATVCSGVVCSNSVIIEPRANEQHGNRNKPEQPLQRPRMEDCIVDYVEHVRLPEKSSAAESSDAAPKRFRIDDLASSNIFYCSGVLSCVSLHVSPRNSLPFARSQVRERTRGFSLGDALEFSRAL